MSTVLFEDLDLNPQILRAITEMGFEEATPIQAKSIPAVLSGRDVIGLRAMMSGNRWERMSDEERIEAVRDMQKTAKKQVLTELVRRKKEAGEIR